MLTRPRASDNTGIVTKMNDSKHQSIIKTVMGCGQGNYESKEDRDNLWRDTRGWGDIDAWKVGAVLSTMAGASMPSVLENYSG